MTKIFTFLICTFAFIISANSQNEASNWYFGENAGINFNVFTGTVSSVSDGKIKTIEGCASISNSAGELLFYTDGVTVYNKSHNLMANGNGLLGDESSTQSAIVVPKPNDPNIYYIFTVGSNQTDSGLNYSIVNMAANSGLGQITSKNIPLLQTCAEKIAAVVKDCDTKSIWVIAYGNSTGVTRIPIDTFFAFEINLTGVNSTPVKSTTAIQVEDARGYLKLSPDGTKLACANSRSGMYLFDFNSDTGIVSNPLRLQIGSVSNNPYGVEFSPSSELLYVTASNDYFNNTNPLENNVPSNHSSALIQYNLKAPDIIGSQVIIDTRQLYRGALQLGPNGKIYRALSDTYNSGVNYLGVINNPDNLGLAANYQHNAVNLGPNKSKQGLPPFIASFFNKQIDIIQNGGTSAYLPLCENTSYTLAADFILGATYSWTRNGSRLTETDFDLIVTQSGNYKVVIDVPGTSITKECGFPQGEAIVEFFPKPTALNTTLYQCDLDPSTVGITTFNLTEANELITRGNITGLTVSFYNTQSDAFNKINPIINTDTFENNFNGQLLYARVDRDVVECFEIATLTLEAVNAPISYFKANPLCDEQDSEDGINTIDTADFSASILAQLNVPVNNLSVTYFKNITDALLEKNPISSYVNSNPYFDKIYFRIENFSTGGCLGINELEITIDKLPNVVKNETAYYCLNKYPESIILNAGLINDSPNNYTYSWSNGDTGYETSVDQAGIYTVVITNSNGCSKQRTIKVENSNIAIIENINIVDLTKNNTITVLISNQGSYEFALYNDENVLHTQYQESNMFENVSPGIYEVYVRDKSNDCGTTIKKVSVIGFPKFFTPNGDGYNDIWQVYGVSNMFQPHTKIHIFDRFGKLLKEISPLEEGWNGLFNGKELPVDDYWFSVKLQDGRIFKNHFSLKR